MPRHPPLMPASTPGHAQSVSARPRGRAGMPAARPRLSAPRARGHSRPMDKTTQQALLAALPRTAPARPPRGAERWLAAVLAAVQVFALGGCTWLSLSWGVFSYPTTQRGEAANVAVHGDWAYVTRGAVGVEVVRVGRNAKSHVFAPPAGMESVDDVAIA